MTKHKSHDERREQILAAARTRFIRDGYAHTRVDDIATEAQLSKGGIYFHFRSKREIFDALFEDHYARTSELLSAADQLSGDAVEKLTQLAGAMVSHFAHPDDGRKFLIVLAEMGMRDELIMERIRKAHTRYVETLHRHMREGIASGGFREDVDPEQVAMLLKMFIDGIEQAIVLGYRVDTNALLLNGLRVILHGLARPA